MVIFKGEVGSSNLKTCGRSLRVLWIGRNWWDSFHFQGSLSFIVASKLKALKVDLRKWNEEVFGDVERKKKILWEEVCVVDIIEEVRALDDEERMKAEIFSELERSTLMEEVS